MLPLTKPAADKGIPFLRNSPGNYFFRNILNEGALRPFNKENNAAKVVPAPNPV
jgi:hypothetical protein